MSAALLDEQRTSDEQLREHYRVQHRRALSASCRIYAGLGVLAGMALCVLVPWFWGRVFLAWLAYVFIWQAIFARGAAIESAEGADIELGARLEHKVRLWRRHA